MPQYLIMIIPSRWFAGGKGLDDFRTTVTLQTEELRSLSIMQIVLIAFPGVNTAGGVNYFLWQKDYNGPCEITSIRGDSVIKNTRFLDEYDICLSE